MEGIDLRQESHKYNPSHTAKHGCDVRLDRLLTVGTVGCHGEDAKGERSLSMAPRDRGGRHGRGGR